MQYILNLVFFTTIVVEAVSIKLMWDDLQEFRAKQQPEAKYPPTFEWDIPPPPRPPKIDKYSVFDEALRSSGMYR